METGNEHIHPSDALLSDIVDQVLAIAEPLARDRGLVLHVRAPAADAMLFTDARKLRQIMLNLLSNAFKFTNEGSVTFSTTLSGDDLIVDITDTGIGIEPDDLNTIFRPFWQAEGPLTRHAGGTGLGLSVSRRLAELLGGTITVTSEPGVGSTFTLRVPATIAGPRAGR
jgi:signal transduction histidine kinase